MIVAGRDDERTSGAGGTRPLALAIPPPAAARRRKDTALNRACTTRRAGPLCVRREPLVHICTLRDARFNRGLGHEIGSRSNASLLIAHHAEEIPPPRVTCCCARPDLETRRIGRVARRGVSRDAASPIPHHPSYFHPHSCSSFSGRETQQPLRRAVRRVQRRSERYARARVISDGA